MKKNKKIYFVGIKGVGMTPLAIIAKETGFNVLGSDIDKEFITDKTLKEAGIIYNKGFSPDNITSDINLLITTGAHNGLDNIEVKKARELGIKVLTQGEAVGEFMRGEIFNRKTIGISVTGCHGKTTTSAMVATIFKENNMDPSYIIGTSEILSLGLPGHFGKGKYFIAEADEYSTESKYDKTPKLLWQKPKIIVFTNLEFDHPDVYSSVDEIKDTFLKFANQNKDATVIYNADDINLCKALESFSGKKISFGYSRIADYVLKKVSVSEEQVFFWVEYKGTLLGEFVINTSGEYNAVNALSSIIVAIEEGLVLDKIKTAIAKYKGAKRRLEYIGKTENNALIYDDYAHHPTEIKNVLASFKKMYPKKKIICIFQSHTYSRTKSLLSEFSKAFTNADSLILTKIFASAREKNPNDDLSKQFYLETVKNHPNTMFLPEFIDVVKYAEQKGYNNENVLVTMGAGDVYKIGEELKERN